MTSKKTLVDRIAYLNPCREAVVWLTAYTSAIKAWDECPRGDWMLWLLGKTIKSDPWTDERKPLLTCALSVAETVKHLWRKESVEAISNAIQILRNWITGSATVEEAQEARSNLYAVDTATYAVDTAAYAAVDTATYAVDTVAAYAAVDTAAAATATAAALAAALAATANAAANKESLKLTADIVRKSYPKPPKIN